MLRPVRAPMGDNSEYQVRRTIRNRLIAIDPVNLERYHIESSVSASKGFSRLTAKIFDPNDLKVRVKIPAARRTLGYFRDKKFAASGIVSRLREYGFTNGNYKKVIVTWGWTEDAKREADAAGIEGFP